MLLTLYPCSNKTREVLENQFPTPERFPSEISRAEGMDFPIPFEFWWNRKFYYRQSFYRKWIVKSFFVLELILPRQHCRLSICFSESETNPNDNLMMRRAGLSNPSLLMNDDDEE